MAEFRFSCEEANLLLDEIDCNPNSVLDGTPPGDGLNFDDLDFDWDNDALEIALGGSLHGVGGANESAELSMNKQQGYESPEHVSPFHDDLVATVTPREHSDLPEPLHAVVGECRTNHTSTKVIADHGHESSVISGAPSPPPPYRKNQEHEFEPVPLRDFARQPTRTQRTLAPVPDLPLSSQALATSSKPHAVLSKPDAVASRKPRAVPSKLFQSRPMDSIAFNDGVSDDPVSTKSEAKRRRAVRKDILSSQRKSRVPVSRAAPPMSSSVLSSNEVAMEVTEIAQMLLQDASFTSVPSNPILASLQSELKVPCMTKVAPVTTKRDVPMKQAPPRVSVARVPEAKAKKVPHIATTVEKANTCKSPSKTKVQKSASTKAKAARKTSETSYDDDCMSMCPDGPGSADIAEHLADLPAGTDPESRRQRRLIRNRLSAALHRKRKRDTIDNQQKVIDEKDDEIARLQKELNKV
jgi:hypothetical protein